MQRDLKRDDAAQGISERGMFRTGHAGVGNHDGVAFQFVAMRFEKFCEIGAADFFLAFDDECQIAGQGSIGLEIGFDGFEMGEMLAFVIRAAARKEPATFESRFKRRVFP